MTVVKIGDGLGNQIYNYVAGYAVSKFTNTKLILDTSECDNSKGFRPYQLDLFNIHYDEKFSLPNDTTLKKVYKKLYRDVKYHVVFENEKFFRFPNQEAFSKHFRETYLHGWFQNLSYFYMYEEDLRKMLTPKKNLSNEVNVLMHQLSNNNTCAIHVRAGDMNVFSKQYYESSINIMLKKRDIDKFIVFSNDFDVARTLFSVNAYKEKFVFLDELISDATDFDTFNLLKSCRNQIIPYSTYSRWAAILNSNPDKVVVCPDSYKSCNEDYNRFVYPSDWLLVKE